jgi:hypothetical protein
MILVSIGACSKIAFVMTFPQEYALLIGPLMLGFSVVSSAGRILLFA